MYFCIELQIPFCLDVFHNRISNDHCPITKRLLRKIFSTWSIRNLRPKIHISEQQLGLKKSAHSATLNRIPLFLLKIPTWFEIEIDLMLEVKDKEVSVFKMYHKYFDIKSDIAGRISYQLKEKYR